ncbi:metallophosphoesterase [Gloeocapsopsis dulcis]|uniref:Metallophosphoesterase n=1 Tax=Gloeocapsopsis dulcis AAB1 = 1H9 TaxID=1433147 RepID=A0A6N8G3F7_9CHRO|nr:metallophosphoesterase [Gloeocapsopsis dulcis]MUL39332.1 metallophosphoesterase [Gloeocapsopsis dulcis AAB1 = 1H9]WNN91711.1 metallophosphoesterase [Gloeocapsopsis dulcis]
MEFVSDPPISVKIEKMKQRVRWQDRLILERQIDQTRFVFASEEDSPEFSFLVVGDSGSGKHRKHNPQRQIAERMLEHCDRSQFVLHTGDVVYLVGSSEYYPKNFIEPYHEFIVGGEKPKKIAYDKMTFKTPILPVLGNHDYYDLPLIYGLMGGVTLPIRRTLKLRLDLDVGWHGSYQGKAYAKAFIDYLKAIDSDEELQHHLDKHYTATTSTGRCLLYEPGNFTRLPYRYYTFRSGGIDFFALDSNTFNAPAPLPRTGEGEVYRRTLEARIYELEQEKLQIMEEATKLNSNSPEDAERLDDLEAKLEQIEEVKLDIDKQLAADESTVTDFEQLTWLRQRLIESWNTPEVRGRVIYLHHPPYVTEASKWYQAQTLAVRRNLRWVLDEVAKELGGLPQRSLVDLVLTGHAHCLEHLSTGNTGHADSYINWIICGGSGYSLRRQRKEGTELKETFGNIEREVARSHLYIGRSGHGLHKRRPYSFLRIDVKAGNPAKFVVQPFVTERFQRDWFAQEIEPFSI